MCLPPWSRGCRPTRFRCAWSSVQSDLGWSCAATRFELLLAATDFATISTALPAVSAVHLAAHRLASIGRRDGRRLANAHAVSAALTRHTGVARVVDAGGALGAELAGDTTAGGSCNSVARAFAGCSDVGSCASGNTGIAVRLAVAATDRTIVHGAHLGTGCALARTRVTAHAGKGTVLRLCALAITTQVRLGRRRGFGWRGHNGWLRLMHNGRGCGRRLNDTAHSPRESDEYNGYSEFHHGSIVVGEELTGASDNWFSLALSPKGSKSWMLSAVYLTGEAHEDVGAAEGVGPSPTNGERESRLLVRQVAGGAPTCLLNARLSDASEA